MNLTRIQYFVEVAKRENILKDISDQPFVSISREESPGGYAQLLSQCAACGFRPNIVRETSTLESLLLCVETGIGVALIDPNTRLENDGMVRIVTIPDSDRNDLVAVWKAGRRNHMVEHLVTELSLSEGVPE